MSAQAGIPNEPDVRLRATWGPQETVRILTRNLTLEAAGRTSWSPAVERPSALDHLLVALATDLLAGLAVESRRAGPPVSQAELRLQARLSHPLFVAGVVGESGSAGLAAIGGSLYLASDAGEADVSGLWQRVLERAPVHATLAAAIPIHINITLTP